MKLTNIAGLVDMQSLPVLGPSDEVGPEVGVWTVADVIEMDEAKAHYDEALREVDSSERDLYILEDAGVKLDEMIVSTESFLASGGLSVNQAHRLSLRMESAYSTVGLEGLVENRFPSMESFGSSDSRVTATNVALEDLKEKAMAIGKAILEKLKQIIEFIGNFIGSVLKSLPVLKKRAQALLKAAESKSTTKADGKMPNYNGAAVKYDGKPDAASIIKGLNATATQLAGFMDGTIEYQNALAEIVSKEVPNPGKNEGDANFKAAEAKFDELALKNSKLMVTIIGDVKTEFKNGMLAVVRDGGNVPGDSNLPSIANIEAIAKGALKVIEALESKKGKLDELKKINQDMANKVKGLDSTRDKLLIKLYLWGARKGMGAHATRLCNYAYTGTSAAIAYGEKALKQYK